MPQPVRRTAFPIPAVIIASLGASLTTATAQTGSTPAAPSTQPTQRLIRIPGTLAADRLVEIYAKVSGYVESIDVDIGARVKKGDTLLRINIPESQDELRSAQAALAASRAKAEA